MIGYIYLDVERIENVANTIGNLVFYLLLKVFLDGLNKEF